MFERHARETSLALRLLGPALLTVSFALAPLATVSLPAPSSDPHPALAHIEAGVAGMRSDPEASRRHAQQALALLSGQPDADLEIRARLLLCDYYSERDLEAARAEIAAAEARLAEAKRPGLLSGIVACQGETFETEGKNDRALELYDRAVAIGREHDDDEMTANALYARGFLQGLQGEYALGMADFREAQALYDKLGKPHHSLTALNGIATLFNRMGDYAQAQRMYSRALRAQTEAGMRREQAVTLHNLARAYENLQQWDAAQDAFARSALLSRELSYPRGEAYALRGLAAVANARGNPQAALRTLDHALALQQTTPDTRLHALIQLERGIALRQLQRLPDSAAALEASLEVFRRGEARTELARTLTELAAANAAMAQWQAAYAYQVEAQATAERLLRNQLDQRFTTLKVEFDTIAKEQENALLLLENEANEKALAQERRARSLQATVIALTVVLALLLATLALHQRRSTLRMRRLAMTDELTGVPNRRAVLARLDALLRDPEAGVCAMLIVDIDHFKAINDTHGHAEGDQALKLVASGLRKAVVEPAYIGRLGGEEFMIVLPGTDEEGACRAAERLRARVMEIDTQRWLANGPITVSIGVTVSEPGTDTPSTMLQRADQALYAAKRAGRNCVRVHRPSPVPPDEPALADAATAG